jgi:hypothetical protein
MYASIDNTSEVKVVISQDINVCADTNITPGRFGALHLNEEKLQVVGGQN